MGASYKTDGTFYVNPTMAGDTGLIALEVSDYEKLLACGLMDKEEVLVALEKVGTGSEYSEGVPTYKTKAGVYTIKMDGTIMKPQADLTPTDISRMRERGFRDLDKVKVTIEPLPYEKHREASYGELRIDA